MKRLTGLSALSLAISATTLGTTAATAGGLERSILNVAPLYEDGRYFELSASYVMGDLEGVGGTIPPGFLGPNPIPVSGSSGNLLENYATIGLAYKADISESLSYALFVNQPYGANTSYPFGTSLNPVDARNVYGGSGADVKSYALTALLAYDVTPRVKIYGGPVFQSITPEATVSFISSYNVTADTDYGIGFVVGASYSIPDIALRVGLTYRSEIGHSLDTVESSDALGVNTTRTDFNTPQSVTLDFQTGVAKDTLVFGQINWVDWSDFTIAPPNYVAITSAAVPGGRPLVSYGKDWTSYTLGVGRRFNEQWAGALSFTYEPQTDVELTSLGPIDGRFGINLGATYETEKMKITGGISYSMLGEARNLLNSDFSDGSAIGIGFRVGWKL